MFSFFFWLPFVWFRMVKLVYTCRQRKELVEKKK